MTLGSRTRKLILTTHVATSVGSLGAVVVFLVLAIVGLSSPDLGTVRAAYIANAVIAWFVILPLISASLVIGTVQALVTQWGLIRHYWVLAKLALTALTVGILLLQMDGIDLMAALAAGGAPLDADGGELRNSLWLHAAGGLLVLVVITALSIYKPRGLTPYGWRRRYEAAGRA